MRTVYGVVPSELLSSGNKVAEFPAFSARPTGGRIPLDCDVSLVELPLDALNNLSSWPWAPRNRGYLVVIENAPAIELKKHLRQIRLIKDELGQVQLWPWFDPRYLKLAIAHQPSHLLAQFFGPICAFVFQSENDIEFHQLKAGKLNTGNTLS